MSTTTNYPSATPQSQPPKKDYKNLVIGLLAAGFLGTWGYLLWNNNKNEQDKTLLQTQVSKVTDEKGQLQKNFDDALVRLDSLTGTNNKLTSQVNEGNGQISNLKKQIRGILSKQRMTEAEKKKAEDLIKELNDKVNIFTLTPFLVNCSIISSHPISLLMPISCHRRSWRGIGRNIRVHPRSLPYSRTLNTETTIRR